MNNDIGENFLLYESAKEILDAARETYSSSGNTYELFQVEAILHEFRQGDQSVTRYFNTLTRHWQHLDLFKTHLWKCTEDAVLYKKIVEQKRTFKFLLGLNKNLDEVRGRVMDTKPLPSLREAFSEVRREESQKKVMMGSHESAPSLLEASVLAACSSNALGNHDSRQKRGRPWCEHGWKPGHYKETCWKLHGKPANWKPGSRSSTDRDSHAHVAAIPEKQPILDSSPFSKEQMDILQKLLNQATLNSLAPGTCLAAQKELHSAFTANKGIIKPWTIDSGASDHMTGDATLF